MKIFKRKNLIVFSVILLAVIISYVFFLIKQVPKDVAEEGQAGIDEEIEVYPIRPEPIDSLPKAERDVLLQKRMERRSELITSYNKPIEFYGQIVDQFNQPVPGVSVVVKLSRWNPLHYRPASTRFSIRTDAEGKFSIQDKKGLYLSFDSFSKTGYAFQRVDFSTSRTEPLAVGESLTEPGRPFVIRAYKIGEVPEKLLIGEADFYHLVPDGRVYSLDLVTQEMREGHGLGQIRVSYMYAAGANTIKPADWTVSLEANGGGVIETTDTLMFEAPETGYQPKWTASFTLGSPDWRTLIRRKFYLKAHNGRIYGRLEIEFDPFFAVEGTDTLIGIRYWLNPEGSRNLYTTKKP